MIVIDAMGDTCPLPVIKAKKAIEDLKAPEVLEILVDNETAVQNLFKLAASKGAKASSVQLEERKYKVTIAPKVGLKQKKAAGDTVVVVSSDKMGEGDAELGKTLMKSFLFALSELDEPPQTILFYNRGAFLTCEDSDSIEDLKNMQERGTEVMTCGLCLDYYGLKEKLMAGSVTNMYHIAEAMATAGRIIRP